MFDPFSKLDFFKRLETYSLSCSKLNPVTCAASGWILKNDCLFCEECFAFLYLSKKMHNSKIHSRYLELLKQQHKIDCLWHHESCKMCVYSFPLILDPKTYINEFPKIRVKQVLPSMVEKRYPNSTLAILNWRKENEYLRCSYCSQKVILTDDFDPILNHRWYCIWRNEYMTLVFALCPELKTC